MKKLLRLLALFLAIVSACWADESIDALLKKAEKGDADAQCKLGSIYAYGDGVLKDSVEAMKWYQEAAELGNTQAQLWIGIAYAYGHGVTKDLVEAMKWYQKAAKQGDIDGQYRLGEMYAINSGEGNGVMKNLIEAHAWFNIAGAGGMDAAKRYRDQLELKMTQEQIIKATQRAKELMATIKKQK